MPILAETFSFERTAKGIYKNAIGNRQTFLGSVSNRSAHFIPFILQFSPAKLLASTMRKCIVVVRDARIRKFGVVCKTCIMYVVIKNSSRVSLLH